MAAKKFCLIYVTAKNEDEARKLGLAVVEKKLAASANILPRMHSIYWWKKKVEEADEAVLLIKTLATNYLKVEKYISEHHSYVTPCIFRISIDGGAKPYLKWLSESVLG